jgi:UDP-2,4-diacetamido-2,4,6-trideoxy-beta-L-altropyranose hydrolase
MNPPHLRLRPIGPGDCRLIWQWANDPDRLAMAFSSEPIVWETHLAWFDARLVDPNTRMFLFIDESGEAAAQVRFEIDAAGDAEVDVTVAPEKRGEGVGPEALRLGTAELFAVSRAVRTVAHIKPENAASQRAFAHAGYRAAGTVRFKGREVIEMVCDRGEQAEGERR